VETQISSVNGFVEADLDNDGKSEIALGGNLFSSEVETPRNDASIGTILEITKQGFESVPASKAGLYIPGDVKALQSIRLANGSLGILVANNNDGLQLFRTKSNSSS